MNERRSYSSEELAERLPYSINANPKPTFPELLVPPDNQAVIRFSEEHKKILKKHGYQIFSLQGASLSDLRQVDFIKTIQPPFSSDYENRPLPATEVAFNLKTGFQNISQFASLPLITQPNSSFFIPDTKLKSGKRKILSLHTIVGSSSMYSELAFHHYQKTGLPLWTNQDACRTGYLITTTRPKEPKVNEYYCVGGKPSRDVRLSIYVFDQPVKHIDLLHRLLLVVPVKFVTSNIT